MLCKIGAVEIWRILEWNGPFRTPEQLFPNAGDDVRDLIETEAPGTVCPQHGGVTLPVQGFLLRTPSHLVLVDACIGNHKASPGFADWNMRDSDRFMNALGAAGAVPADVDYVLCTHLHTDHIGWNTQLVDGRWVPTFPNARYLLPEADLPLVQDHAAEMVTESISPVIEAGQADMVGPDYKIGDDISLIPTSGHMPGHVSVQIESQGARAVITGDAIHITAQCRYPDWHFTFDADAPQAVASRRALLEMASETGQKVLGTHFALPSVGRVQAKGDHFKWEAD